VILLPPAPASASVAWLLLAFAVRVTAPTLLMTTLSPRLAVACWFSMSSAMDAPSPNVPVPLCAALAVVALALGYRGAGDKYAGLAKVRYTPADLIKVI